MGSARVLGGNVAGGSGVTLSLLGHSPTQTSASHQPVPPPQGLGQGQSHTKAQEKPGMAVPVPLPGLWMSQGRFRTATASTACFVCFLSQSDLPYFLTAVPLLSK